MKTFILLIGALLISGSAMAGCDHGGGDGGSRMVDRMIQANEAAMQRY